METIIYIAILATVLVVITSLFLTLMKTTGNIRLARKINSAAEISMERMVREIRLANDIDAAGSVFGSHPGRLKLNTIDINGSPATVEFYLSGSGLMIKDSDGVTENLTPSAIEVNGLVFNQILTSTTSRAIKIRLEIKGTNGNFQKTEYFYDTVVLRRSHSI